MILRLFKACRRDLSQMVSFIYANPRFTTTQSPISPKHRTSLFDKPRTKLFAARIHQILSTNLETIWSQMKRYHWSTRPSQLVGALTASCTSPTLKYSTGQPGFGNNKNMQSWKCFWQTCIPDYHKDTTFKVAELTIFNWANTVETVCIATGIFKDSFWEVAIWRDHLFQSPSVF